MLTLCRSLPKLQPELFAGDIRQNLDPFSQYSDAELSRALLSAQGLSEGDPRAQEGMKLDTRISGDGDLSAGERQIIALARAIVRKSKLLIMDEGGSPARRLCPDSR